NGLDFPLRMSRDWAPPPTKTMTLEEREADRRTGAMDQAWGIRFGLMTSDESVTVIGGPLGGVVISAHGGGAFDALDEIKRSVKYGVPDGRIVPKALLKEIIAAQPHH